MSKEEFKFSNKSILLENKEELGSSYKIKSYNQKLKLIKEKNIPQKPIKDVLNHLFFKNSILSKKAKDSISKIIYSQKDRIIIAITKFGKEIIWSRDKLVREYGWFFFVSEDEKRSPSRKKRRNGDNKPPRKKEETISIEKYEFNDLKISLKQKENMRSLYHTKEYFNFFKLIKSRNIKQMPIKEVLNDFFTKDKLVPEKEKKAIRKVIYYEKENVIVVKSLIGDKMYENLKKLVIKYGWYFYITGVPVGPSVLSIAIDKIEKRFSSDYFNETSLLEDPNQREKIRVSLYPIVLKPNHNCIILGLGKCNILLDCGISDEYFQHIEFYLENLHQLILNKEKELHIAERIEISQETEETEETEENVEKKLENIESLREFETKTKDLENDDELNTIDSKEGLFKPKIDAVFISHSHFDHISGLKEVIKLYPDVPIFCSRITLDLYMLRDSNFLKQESHDEIEQEEYQNVIKNVIYVENGEKIEFKDKDCYLSFFHAGHMPGALMLMAKTTNFRFLYTGDYTYYDITPFAGTRRFLEQISRPIDFLLIDAVCANEDFGDPSQQFHSLILFLEQKAEYGDNTLIGADPSSLAISFMLTFWRYFRKLQLRKDYKNRPNIYVDQMVRKNIQVLNHRYEYIYGPISRLIREKANPFNSIKFRWFDLDDLEFLRTKNNIIISHPPDLSYGIIRNIINSIGRSPHNLVFLSGAIHEQPGIDLIEGNNEIEFSETWKMPFRSLLLNTFVPQLKIKLHGDKTQLKEMIKNLEPRQVCFFHQSPRVLIETAKEVENSFDFVEKVSVPRKRDLMILN